MKKSILFLIITLLTCSSQYMYPGIFGGKKVVVVNYSGIADTFRKKAEEAKTMEEYNRITADYARFIRDSWPVDKPVPPLDFLVLHRQYRI